MAFYTITSEPLEYEGEEERRVWSIYFQMPLNERNQPILQAYVPGWRGTPHGNSEWYPFLARHDGRLDFGGCWDDADGERFGFTTLLDNEVINRGLRFSFEESGNEYDYHVTEIRLMREEA